MDLLILARQDIQELADNKIIIADAGYLPISAKQIQPASLDLRLGTNVWIIPQPGQFDENSDNPQEMRHMTKLIGTDTYTLKKGMVYIIDIQEMFHTDTDYRYYDKPKSSAIRANLATTLVIKTLDLDGNPLPYAKLYLECIPGSFNCNVTLGMSLCQVFVCDLTPRPDRVKFPIPDTSVFRVNLKCKVIAYMAHKNTRAIYDLSAKSGSMVNQKQLFWKEVTELDIKNNGIFLKPNSFYLLSTIEPAKMFSNRCGSIVEFREECMYVFPGFIDPGFQQSLTLGVFTQKKPVFIEHGTPICNVEYFNLLNVPKDRDGRIMVYGSSSYHSSYHNQVGPTLGKQFLQIDHQLTNSRQRLNLRLKEKTRLV